MVKNVAIVEDEEDAKNELTAFLMRYGEQNDERFAVTHFADAESFLSAYKANFDLVFMDIEMPNMDGITASFRLREIDKTVMLIFATNLARFAVKGYEVGAFGYILKPLSYYDFSLQMKRALQNLNVRQGVKLKVFVDGITHCLDSADIKYIEVINHHLIYHTVKEDIKSYGSLKQIEKELMNEHFRRCHNCYLVNFRYVTKVQGFDLYIGDEILQISQTKRKEFIKDLTNFLGGNT